MSIHHEDAGAPVVAAERRVRAERHAGDSWNASQRLPEALEQRRELVPAVAGKSRFDVGHDSPLLLESEALILKMPQRLQKKAGGREQNQRQSSLEYHQHLPCQ